MSLKKKVALDQGLTDVEEVLKDEGYDVVELNRGENDDALAVVVNGLSENIMGMEDVVTASTIIDASGLNAEQIVEQVKRSEVKQS
jgi:hypothetical protein